MNCLFNIFVVIIIAQCTTAITREQASPGTRVRFHYSEKSKRAQTNQTIVRIADALNGKEAVIMDIPFWRNERRVQIQSVENPDVILAVKPYDLELIDPTMADGETRIDVFVSRQQSTTILKDHIMSEKYYQEELPIANNAQYRAVILNNPRIKLQHRTTQSLVRFNRRQTGIHRDHLTLSLLDQIIEWLERCQAMDEEERRINASNGLRSLLLRCLRVIADSGRGRHELISRIYDLCPSLDEANDLSISSVALFREYQSWTVDEFQQRIASMAPGLNQDAMEFYEKVIYAVSHLPMLDEVIKLAHEVNRFSGLTVVRQEAGLLDKLKNITREIFYSVESMEYYLAVGELLLELRDSGEIKGRIAVNCMHGQATGDWIRALADIAGCQRRDVSLKMPHPLRHPVSQKLHIDLLIPRINSFSESVYHPEIGGQSGLDEYLRQELQVANDAQYHVVVVNIPESKSQATIKINRFNMNSQNRQVLAWLFEQFALFLDRIDGVRYTDKDAKELIKGTLWYLSECKRGSSSEQDDLVSSYRNVIEGHMFHFMSIECRNMIRKHLIRIQQQEGHANIHNVVLDLDDYSYDVMVEFCMYFPFALSPYIAKGWYPPHLSDIINLQTKLNRKASQFYDKQLSLQQELFISEDSEYTRMLKDLNHTLAKGTMDEERGAIIGKQRNIMRRVHQSVDAMKYYLRVGHFLVKLRDTGAALRDIGIICPKEYVNGDWVRALSDIMQCDNRSVTIKMI